MAVWTASPRRLRSHTEHTVKGDHLFSSQAGRDGSYTPGQGALPPPGFIKPLGRDDPATVGPYRLLGRLGSGGMGTVYLARDDDNLCSDRLDRRNGLVAVKVIHPQLAVDEHFRRRFRQEARLASRVAPFCTAPVLDYGEDGRRPYLVTEYVAGIPLSRLAIERGGVPVSHTEGIAVGVVTALTAIHAAGLVHRDLKPSNVLLSLSGPRVIDFGIARALDSPSGITRTGVAVGSPGWMAPEQALGEPITPAADLFAWGCLVVYVATGRHPFGPGDPNTRAFRILHAEPNLTGLPAGLHEPVRAALSREPEARPTARELLARLSAGAALGLEDLDEFTSSRFGPPRPTRRRPRPRSSSSRPFSSDTFPRHGGHSRPGAAPHVPRHAAVLPPPDPATLTGSAALDASVSPSPAPVSPAASAHTTGTPIPSSSSRSTRPTPSSTRFDEHTSSRAAPEPPATASPSRAVEPLRSATPGERTESPLVREHTAPGTPVAPASPNKSHRWGRHLGVTLLLTLLFTAVLVTVGVAYPRLITNGSRMPTTPSEVSETPGAVSEEHPHSGDVRMPSPGVASAHGPTPTTPSPLPTTVGTSGGAADDAPVGGAQPPASLPPQTEPTNGISDPSTSHPEEPPSSEPVPQPADPPSSPNPDPESPDSELPPHGKEAG